MNDFPRMLYRWPAKTKQTAVLQDGKYDVCIVPDQEAMDAAQAEGYCLDHGIAREAGVVEDESPATRPELEAKATELGLKFDGRTGDKKLSAMISEALS